MTEQAKVAWNEDSKSWIVLHLPTGEVAHFPKGPKGRRQAHRCALKMNDPAIHALATYLAEDLYRHHEEVHGRIWRAADIVYRNEVYEPHPHDDPNVHAKAMAHSRHGYYHLNCSGRGQWKSCSCPDFQGGEAPAVGTAMLQPLCKHILAWKMLIVLQRALNPETAPSPIPIEEYTAVEEELDMVNEELFG